MTQDDSVNTNSEDKSLDVSTKINSEETIEKVKNSTETQKIESKDDYIAKPKTIKPPKPEDKPFKQFINEDLIPGLTLSIKKTGVNLTSINLINDVRPVVGGKCWIIVGEFDSGRKFWLTFDKESITSSKNICLSEPGSDPTLIESFLIDERKSTLALFISRVLQRLNGQKWLGEN